MADVITWLFAYTVLMVLEGGAIFEVPVLSAETFATDAECMVALIEEIEPTDDGVTYVVDARCNPVWWGDNPPRSRRKY